MSENIKFSSIYELWNWLDTESNKIAKEKIKSSATNRGRSVETNGNKPS